MRTGAAVVGMGSKLITAQLVKTRDFGIAHKVAQSIGWVRKARGVPPFLGVEHMGLYSHGSATGADIAAWYEQTFGFPCTSPSNFSPIR